MTDDRVTVMDRIQANENLCRPRRHLANPIEVAYTKRSRVWVVCRAGFILGCPGREIAVTRLMHAGIIRHRRLVPEER
jgi:hypothetical protein